MHPPSACSLPQCTSLCCLLVLLSLQVVHVCAEHKKPTKLLKHMAAIKASSEGLRNPPRVLVFANRIKVRIHCRDR